MPMFTLEDVEASFRRVADHLEKPVAAYAIGGAAMARLGVKAATKDIDLVFRHEGQLEAFEAALDADHAKRIHDPEQRARRPGARHLWETADGMGWDLFTNNVIGFRFVHSDYDAAEEWLRHGKLTVYQMPPDLVFIMKAFTPRTRDMDDMAALLTSGAASASRVQQLVARRLPAIDDHAWVARFYQGVLDMGHDHDLDVRWADPFEEAAWNATAAGLIREWLAAQPLTPGKIASKLDVDTSEVEPILRQMERKGIIQRDQKQWRLVSPASES